MGIFAHANAGKTTLTENLLFLNNQIGTIGRVDDGNAVTDDLRVEKSRGITVRSSFVSITKGDNVIQIIDTPGHVDFCGEVERAINVLDFAILVVSAVEGVESQTFTIWNELKKNKIPTIIYINKVDRKNASFEATMEDIRQKLTDKIYSSVDKDYKKLSIDSLAENFCEVDEEFCIQYIEKGRVSKNELDTAIIHSFNRAETFPVFGGSALKGVGIEAIYDYLEQDINNHNIDAEELNAYVYMIRYNNGVRESFVKILSGQIKNFNEIIIADSKYRVVNLRTASGSKLTPIEVGVAGQIVVANGLECQTGSIIGDFYMKSTSFVQPLIKMQIIPERAEDIGRLVEAVNILNCEDPHYEGLFDEYTKETKINLMGEVQAQVLSELIEERFGIRNQISNPRIIYKETPTREAKGKSSYTSVSEIELLVQPLERGEGLIIDSKYSTDFLHIKYQNQAKKLIENYCKQGLFGWNVTDAHISIVGGKFDSMGSEPQHFNICVPLALFRAFKQAEMKTLEPMIEFNVTVPNIASTSVLNSLFGKRARIYNFEKGEHLSRINGLVQFSEMTTFPILLNQLSSGMGTYSYEFSNYKLCDSEQVFEKRFGPDPSVEVKFVISDMKASLVPLDSQGTGKKPRRSKFAREKREKNIATEKKSATKNKK